MLQSSLARAVGLEALVKSATSGLKLIQQGDRYVTREEMICFVEVLGFMVCEMFDMFSDLEQDHIPETKILFVLMLRDCLYILVVLQDISNSALKSTFLPAGARPGKILKF